MSFDSESCNLSTLFQNAVVGINNDDHIGRSIRSSILFCTGVILVSFVISTATKNYSQVDKAWSIVPFVYAWFVVCDERTFLMATLATVWGLRLTWNFNRRGGYSWPPWTGDEDYRWSFLREGFMIPLLKNQVVWMIFNFGFISLYQHFLLWLIASPSIVATLVSSSCGYSPLNFLDLVAAVIFLASLLVESVADNQQYAFQTEKYRQRSEGIEMAGEYKDGFKQSGLFAIVRKPNYAAEQVIWICYYLFSVAATRGQRLWNWSCLGFVLLCLLFQGSGWFTESITIRKYPKYKDYQKKTPLFVPNPFRRIKKS